MGKCTLGENYILGRLRSRHRGGRAKLLLGMPTSRVAVLRFKSHLCFLSSKLLLCTREVSTTQLGDLDDAPSLSVQPGPAHGCCGHLESEAWRWKNQDLSVSVLPSFWCNQINFCLPLPASHMHTGCCLRCSTC